MTEKRSGLKELLTFFLPMTVTASLMMFTHSIVSAGLSRTTDAVVSTAAYAVALSLSDLVGGPLCQIRQTGIALINSRQSFQVVNRVYKLTLGIAFAVLMAIAYFAPVSRLVLQQLLGVKDDLYPATLLAFRGVMFLSLFSGFRYLYHGVITGRRQTKYISVGMLIRVSFMVVLIGSIIRWRWITGPLVGSIAIVSGVGVECLLAYVFGRRLIPQNEDVPDITNQDVWRFYVPLMASSLLFSIGKPFINAGLARMPNATINLAAFSVATSLAMVIIAPSQTIHMLTMVFGRKREDRPLVVRFSTVFAALSTGLVLLVGYTPIGSWILTKLIGVPAETLAPTLLALRTVAFFPLIICWQEYNMGLLLLERSTRLVSIGKAVNLCSTIIFVLLAAPRLPGALAAPLAQLVGYALDGAVLQGGRILFGHKAFVQPGVNASN